MMRVVAVVLVLVCFGVAPARAAGDAVLEAKRKAAADLFRDGKTADAVSLIREVIRIEPGGYKDHLLLGRALDKAGKAGEAVEAYRRVQELLTGATAEERAARVEVERRLKVLDQQTQKVAAAEEEFLKKLEGLEREAIGAKDVRAVQRVFRLKAGVYRAQDRKGAGGAEVMASAGWMDSGVAVTAGRTYRVRSAGAFEMRTGVRCTPDGTDALPANYQGPLGVMMVRVDDRAPVKAGSAFTFTAEQSGRLLLLINGTAEEKRQGAAGSATVLVEQVD